MNGGIRKLKLEFLASMSVSHQIQNVKTPLKNGCFGRNAKVVVISFTYFNKIPAAFYDRFKIPDIDPRHLEL